MVNFRSAAKFDKKATIILITTGQAKSGKINVNNSELKAQLKSLSGSGQFTGEAGEVFPVLYKKSTVLLTGLGSENDLSWTDLRVAVRKALLSSFISKAKDVELIPHVQNNNAITAIIEADLIGTYSWDKYKTKTTKDKSIVKKSVWLVAQKKSVFDDAVKICGGVNLTRDLINDNADVVTSSYITGVIKNLAKNKENVSLEILSKKEMKAKGLNLHLAVNQGSNNEPKLVIAKYSGAGKNSEYTAIIGKGMTFDTGGLNHKPTGSIESMRYDMSGAGAVAGVMKNTIDLNIKKNVLFVFSLAENVTDASSYKPGDVFKSYSGKTVEIGNTDAEGRLVLADAISYVVKNYKPKRIIDIATLTGACVVALGHDYTGMVTTDDNFARQLVRCSNDTDDRVWRMPTYPELKESVKSSIADIRNIGYPRGAGGMITAAEFLRQFTEGTMWAHLDIAGTAFADGQGRMYFGHGATGASVRLLTCFLIKH